VEIEKPAGVSQRRATSITQAISLNFVTIEQVVLIDFGTVAALQAANQEYRHTHSDKDGEDTRVDL